jgi:hypothetical protein
VEERGRRLGFLPRSLARQPRHGHGVVLRSARGETSGTRKPLFFHRVFSAPKKKKQITFKTLGLTAPVISDVTGASGKLRLDLKPTGLDEFEDLVVVGLGSAGEIEFFCGVLFISLE